MAKFFLINTLVVSGIRHLPGESVDDQTPVGQNIIAEGGVVASADIPKIAAAADKAVAAHLYRGASELELEAIMSAALEESQQQFLPVINPGDVGKFLKAGATPDDAEWAIVPAGSGSEVTGAVLIGVTDEVNRTFTTPDKFTHVLNGKTIEVFHCGRRLVQGFVDSFVADYYVSESGGVGTGYDTINMVTFAPGAFSFLVANYLPA